MSTYTSTQLKSMASEMFEMHEENGNIAAGLAGPALHQTAKTAKLAESGFAPAMRVIESEMATAVAMYEAALQFTTPPMQNGKAPYAQWDKATQQFIVNFW